MRRQCLIIQVGNRHSVRPAPAPERSVMHPNLQAAISGHRKLLKKVSVHELQDKIREFRRLDLRAESDEGLAEAISKVLSVELPDVPPLAILRQYTRTLAKGTKFFRARRVDNLDVPPSAGKLNRDAEAPDGKYVKRPGRLHKVGEGLLYTSVENPAVTFRECRIPVGGFAVIFCYRARRDIKASVIGAVDRDSTLTTEERVKINMINDFLYDEFAREVEPDLEHLYRPSEMIGKWYFDGPPPLQDCWGFPSTKSRSILNATFRPNKAHECLDLVGTLLSENVGPSALKVHAIGRPGKKRIDYFPIGSKEQVELFPEISKAELGVIQQ